MFFLRMCFFLLKSLVIVFGRLFLKKKKTLNIELLRIMSMVLQLAGDVHALFSLEACMLIRRI